MYRKYNTMVTAFRLWIYRTPQLKILRHNLEMSEPRVNRNLSFSFDGNSIQNSSSVLGRNVSMHSSYGLNVFVSKKSIYALRKWKRFCVRSLFLRLAVRAVRAMSEKNVVTRVGRYSFLFLCLVLVFSFQFIVTWYSV